MAVKIADTRQSLATHYGTLGKYFGLTTGNPGTSSTPANETSGEGYARVSTTWSNGSGGVINGTAVTVQAKADTYTYAILCSSGSGNNMIDWTAIVDTILSAPGQIVLTPTYTQT